MNAVAGGADWHIGVVLLEKRSAMNAVGVAGVYYRVALGACLSYPAPGFPNGCDIVGPMAVRAHGGVNVAFCKHFEVNAVQRLGVVDEVTALAGLIFYYGHLSECAGLNLGMRIGAYTCVAIGAEELVSVNRAIKNFRVYVKGKLLAASKGYG